MSLFTQFFYLYPYVVILELWALLSLQHPFVFLQVVGWDPKFDRRRKIVVITARLLSDAHRFVLRCLSTHQGVCNCTIFTSISEVRCSHWLLACLPIRYNSYLQTTLSTIRYYWFQCFHSFFFFTQNYQGVFQC